MELEILKSIQSISNYFFDIIFQFFTMFGEEMFTTAILVWIFWNKDKRMGEFVAYSSFTGILLNNTLKDIFNFKRPIGEPGVRSLRIETATGSSFPSGHTQGATSFFGAIAACINKWKCYCLSIIIVLLVGFSRLYLGVHWPKDVIFGILFGVISTIICYKLYNSFKNKFVLYVITFTIFLPIAIFDKSGDLVKGMGTFLGFIIGVILEEKYVKFTVNVNVKTKIIRYILGLIILLIVRWALKIIFPNLIIFNFIRYFIVGIVATYVYPKIFYKFNI